MAVNAAVNDHQKRAGQRYLSRGIARTGQQHNRTAEANKQPEMNLSSACSSVLLIFNILNFLELKES